MPRCEIYGVVDMDGVPQAGASVQVNVHGGGAASLFTTEAGAVAASNPMTTGPDGQYGANQSVWVAEGTYDLVVSGTGFTTATFVEECVRGSNAPGPVLTTTGDIAYASSANTVARLAVGTADQALMGGTTPAYAFPPGHEFSSVKITSPVNITATVEASADTVVTAGAVTFDGVTSVQVEFGAAQVIAGTNNFQLFLFDGSTSQGIMASWNVAGKGGPVCVRTDPFIPGAGSHTYGVRGTVDAGTGQVSGGAGGAGVARPSYIRVIKSS